MDDLHLTSLRAGSIFRNAKLAEIESRAADTCLACSAEYKTLLQQIQTNSQVLDELSCRQAVSPSGTRHVYLVSLIIHVYRYIHKAYALACISASASAFHDGHDLIGSAAPLDIAFLHYHAAFVVCMGQSPSWQRPCL